MKSSSETRARLPVAEQIELEELDLHRLIEGEVQKSSRRLPPCVNKLSLNLFFPRARFDKGRRHTKSPGDPIWIIPCSLILDLHTGNYSLARINFHRESLALGLSSVCQPVVSRPIAPFPIFVSQNENTTCGGIVATE